MAKRAVSTSPKPFCFVLMPFDASFDDIYQLGIKDACEKAGAYCERVDEQIFHERILDRIYNQISKADIIIADMSGRNANVFYEVGYAHALNRRTILITKTADDIPFDLKHFPHIIYSDGITHLKDELTRRIEWCIQNPLSSPSQHSSAVELYLDGIPLSSQRAILRCRGGGMEHALFALHNQSLGVLSSSDIVVCCYPGDELYFSSSADSAVSEAVDKDGKTFYRIRIDELIFPEQSVNFGFYLGFDSKKVGEAVAFDVPLKVFTAQGVMEYSFVLEAMPLPKA